MTQHLKPSSHEGFRRAMAGGGRRDIGGGRQRNAMEGHLGLLGMDIGGCKPRSPCETHELARVAIGLYIKRCV